MQKDLEDLIQNLIDENSLRLLEIRKIKKRSERKRVMIHKHNYTSEIIQRLKNIQK